MRPDAAFRMKIVSSIQHTGGLAVILWYLLSPGGYVATSGHQYICEGMIWSVPDEHSKTERKVWRNSLQSMGPFSSKGACEQELRKNFNLWREAVCVPESDSRVNPATRAYDHFPVDPKT